jgi:hypothetical protein
VLLHSFSQAVMHTAGAPAFVETCVLLVSRAILRGAATMATNLWERKSEEGD